MKNKKNKKRVLLLGIIGLMLLVSIVIGISYAAFRARITKINETNSKINTLVLNNGTCQGVDMTCEGIVPGDRCTKEVTISNPNANKPMVINLYMENTTNEFSSDLNDLVYTLKDKDTGETLIGETVLPESNDAKDYLLTNVTIQGNSSKTYQFVIDYKYLSNISQNEFQGSEFKTSFCADVDQIIAKSLNNVTCNDGESCDEAGDIIDPSGGYAPGSSSTREVVIKKNQDGTGITKREDDPDYEPISDEEPLPDEPNPDCSSRAYVKRVYGEEVAIHHDIYYADSSIYSQGKNKRYVTYCTPFKKGESEGVLYCTRTNRKGKCKAKTGTTECSYESAIKDLGYTGTNKQTFVENFMDTGWTEGGVTTNNWHIKTYCTKEASKTKWTNGGGVYYCNKDKTELHDWYASSTTTTEDIDNIRPLCRIICKRAKITTLHTETCGVNERNWVDYCYNYEGSGTVLTYGNQTTTPGVLNTGDAFDCDVNGDGEYDPVDERFYYVYSRDNGYWYMDHPEYELGKAVLVYSHHTVNGSISDSVLPSVAWASSQDYAAAGGTNIINSYPNSYAAGVDKGPVTARKNLPTTLQWSNVSLTDDTRNITTMENNMHGQIKAANFSYEGYAARLLTAQEYTKGCVRDPVTGHSYSPGARERCRFLLENSVYTDDSKVVNEIFETVGPTGNTSVWTLYYSPGAYNNFPSYQGASIRPAIEVRQNHIEF